MTKTKILSLSSTNQPEKPIEEKKIQENPNIKNTQIDRERTQMVNHQMNIIKESIKRNTIVLRQSKSLHIKSSMVVVG